MPDFVSDIQTRGIERHHRSVDRHRSEGTASLDLRPDGTYSGRGVPDRVFYSTFDDKFGGPADWEHPEGINGTWKMGWNETIKEASVVVDIIDRISGAHFSIDQGDEELELRYFIGDSDYVEFERPN